jgi:7,8-dihydropterin-6-yl-methyl-4-(beta-D-ribofuranosyl)aminobenzene 5'-phosphate synthase
LRRIVVPFVAVIGSLGPPAAIADPPSKLTVLYDAFGEPSTLKKDWGFAALIEYGGRRILFDTENDAAILEHNATTLGVDLKALDCVVISHRHGDHTNNLHYLLKLNPEVPVYVPADEQFDGTTPKLFYGRTVVSLPEHMRYFDGSAPEALPHGTAWQGVNLKLVDASREILPGVSVIATTSSVPGSMELPELSLSLRAPEGQILVVGCSHPGIETILERSAAAELCWFSVNGKNDRARQASR